MENIGRMKISKSARRLYLALSAAVVLIVPSIVMYGEDGNLLVRIAMMLVLSLILWLVYLLIRSLPGKRVDSGI